VANPNQRISILGKLYTITFDKLLLMHSNIGAHASEASAAQFIDDSTLATAGRDATIKVWKLQYHN
jgi:hypothetical protein